PGGRLASSTRSRGLLAVARAVGRFEPPTAWSADRASDVASEQSDADLVAELRHARRGPPVGPVGDGEGTLGGSGGGLVYEVEPLQLLLVDRRRPAGPVGALGVEHEHVDDGQLALVALAHELVLELTLER